MSAPRITILGPNGHVGHAAAKAFLTAGWQVTGFGRSDRHRLAGLDFIIGDAADPEALAAAVAGADVVFNGLNLPYDQWFGGRAEAQLAAVIAAMGRGGKTMLFPGNVYNYAAEERRIAPDTPQNPERPRGEIRVRMETMLAEAAGRGDIRVVLLRAGDFFGPDSQQDFFDQLILREADKGRVALAAHEISHCWAYLPDLARAFVRLAERREGFGAFERFHFSGHFVPAGRLFAAIEAGVGQRLTRVRTPWTLLRLLGIGMPVLREVVKMRYLWDNPMQLVDPRLEALLGPDFGTPFEEAVRRTVARYFTARQQAA